MNTPALSSDTIGYVRVSTEQQAGESRTSLPEQMRAITEHAEKLGRVLLEEAIFIDPGVSGATAEGRPGFMAMIRFCEANPRSSGAGRIVVLNDSRFGRFDDLEEAQHWRFVLKKLGWVVRFVENDESDDPLTRFFIRGIGAAQATEYRQNLKRTAKRASRATAERGLWGREAPFGYRRLATRTDGSQRVLEIGQRKSDDEVVRLTPGPEQEQKLIRDIFTTYARGESLGRLATILAQLYPDRQWSKGVLNAVLKNPSYVGDIVHGRRPQVGHRKQKRETDLSKLVVVRDAHPALVTRETFATVQARLVNNRVERRIIAGSYALSGMITCATCGGRMMGGGGRKGPASNPDRFKVYRDVGSDSPRPGKPAVCLNPMATINKHWLESTVIHEVSAVVTRPNVQAVIVAEIDRALSAAHGNHSERRAQLTAELTDLHTRRSRIVSSIGAGTITERDATITLTDLRAKIAGVEAELERLQALSQRTASMHRIRERLIDVAQNFTAAVESASGPTLRELIRPWLAAGTYDKHRRVLTLRIRRVPEVFGMDWDTLRPQARRVYDPRLYVTRRIPLPDTPQAAAKRQKREAR